MRVLIVSGIWPPDVGGPASHAPAFADFLAERGHAVEVVTTAAAPPEPRDHPVGWVDRAAPPGVLHARVVRLVAARARAADVVYATSMSTRSALGAALARTPLVLKLAGDVAYERARRRGLFGGDLSQFQEAKGLRLAALARARTAAVARARTVVVPSEFLARIVTAWGIGGVEVVPNPAPRLPELPPREPRAAPTLAFAGRLTAAKSLEVAFRALEQVPEATLLVVGDGEERARLERIAGERVRFLGALPREQVLRVLRDADGVLLPSRWENFPHVLVEALAVGTPVVATRVGGVPEIVEDGVNGVLVEPEDPAALAAGIRTLLAERERLAAAAAPSVERFAPEAVYGRLERLLAATLARR